LNDIRPIKTCATYLLEQVEIENPHVYQKLVFVLEMVVVIIIITMIIIMHLYSAK